jgi:hypothetical protein
MKSATGCGVVGLHPPSAIANPTVAPPTITINMPIAHGRRPEYVQTHTRLRSSMTIAIAFDMRMARAGSRMKASGSIAPTTSKNTPNPASQSSLLRRGLSGPSIRFNFSRISSNCVGDTTEASNGGIASAMMRYAAPVRTTHAPASALEWRVPVH